MSDLNLQLSQLIDNELAKDESVKLLEQVLEQPELASKLRRYEWVGSVIKADDIIHSEVDFVGKVSQTIKQEAVVFAPVWRQQKTSWQTLSAIAATVAIIAIIGFGGMQLAPDSTPTAIAVAETTEAVKQAPITVENDQQVITVATIEESPSTKVDPRFIEYLEAHDNSLYAAGSSGFQSYVRVVNHGQK